MGTELSRNDRTLVSFNQVDTNSKVADFSEIVWHLDSGAPAFSMQNLRVVLTRLDGGQVACSAAWKSRGTMGNYFSGYTLKIELCDLNVPLGEVDLGYWEVKCGQDIDFSSSAVVVPANYLTDITQACVPSIEIVAASC